MQTSFYQTWELIGHDDPCRRKHGGVETSDQAHERVKLGKSAAYTSILQLVEGAGAAGVTLKEICVKLRRTPNQLSGRLTELAAAKRIRRNGLRRDGAFAWVLNVA